jgi:hypothetical protein
MDVFLASCEEWHFPKGDKGMSRKQLLAALCFSISAVAHAGMVTLDPDDFVAGTDLSAISPLVTLSTGAGGSVYASGVYPRLGEAQPPDVTTTGPLGKHVFSQGSADNSEWFAWPEEDMSVYDPALWALQPQAFVITFASSVNYASLLAAEIIADAGCCSSDPVRWWVYDSTDQLIISSYVDDSDNIVAYLGTEDFGEGPFPSYPVWRAEFNHPDIRRIVIGGESEPTTIDHLQFRTIDVPEPMSGVLFLTALLIGGAVRRKNAHSR